eukprot:2981742-Pleurochrysis_carterae.AAC.1
MAKHPCSPFALPCLDVLLHPSTLPPTLSLGIRFPLSLLSVCPSSFFPFERKQSSCCRSAKPAHHHHHPPPPPTSCCRRRRVRTCHPSYGPFCPGRYRSSLHGTFLLAALYLLPTLLHPTSRSTS